MTFSAGNIVLVGMMGAGKTRVGKELSRRLNLPFFDSDAEIEQAMGLPVAEIFEKRGEALFREAEKETMLRLLKNPPCVIATGGGAFMQQDIRDAVLRHSICIWLQADFDTLYARTKYVSHRPLLQGDRAEKLKSLMAAREPVYAQAHIAVVSDGRSPKQTAMTAEAALGAWRSRCAA